MTALPLTSPNSVSSVLFDSVLKVSATAIKEEEREGNKIGKEDSTLSLCADSMILYLKDLTPDNRKYRI